jgi:general secretion pathway protein K
VSKPGLRPRQPARSQAGAAIVTALLIVMLAATLASFLLAQQSEALTRLERSNERGQLLLHANTTLDWARSALLAQQRNSTYVALNQPWAQGLVAQPMETATASGVLVDAQSRFNLNNLVGSDGKRRDADVEVFSRLLTQLQLDPGLADAVVDWIDTDNQVSGTRGAENDYYWSQRTPWRAANRGLVQIDELARVRGITPEVLARLRPYVTALPLRTTDQPGQGGTDLVRTRVNVNTASKELLAALLPAQSSSTVDEIVRLREMPFMNVADLKERFKGLPPGLVDQFLDTRSSFFEATLAITGQHSQIRQSALLRLSGSNTGVAAANAGWPSIIWTRDL